MTDAKHCLVIGVGPGLGLACVRRFTADGYAVSMIARHAGRLETWTGQIAGSRGHAVDIADVDAFRATLDRIADERGLPDVIVYNAARATFGQYRDIAVDDFERNFRVNTTGLLVTAQALAPAMAARGRGSIVVTGNTAALRGTPRFVGWASTKAAQRILAESLARELGPQGVHVAYVVVDARIDMPFARRQQPDRPVEELANPDELAVTVFNVAHQPKSAWSFYVELRPFCEPW